jgi:hypothetical protein
MGGLVAVAAVSVGLWICFALVARSVRSSAARTMPTFVDISCWECWETIPRVDADADRFYCETCERQYRFLLCRQCESVNQIRGQSGDVAVCQWCDSGIRIRSRARGETAAAEEWHSELDERGVLKAEFVLVTGFVLLGGSGYDVEIGATCSVITLPDAVDVRAELGGVGVATILYTEMTGLDVADDTTQSPRYIGGGFGLAGAAEGLLVASLLNSLTRKSKVNTGLAITSAHGELLLSHKNIAAAELRRRLSLMFTRFRAARHEADNAVARAADPMANLERLAKLREQGLLSDEEYESARRLQVRRLTEGP